MRKTLLIARREYLAFVRTIGFWLSLFTLPLIIGSGIFIPMLINHSVGPQSVAVLDLSGDHLDDRLRDLIKKHEAQPGAMAFVGAVAHRGGGELKLVALPPGLTPDMTLDAAEARIPALLRNDKAPTLLVAYDRDNQLHFHIWSDSGHKGDLAGLIQSDLDALQYDKLAQLNGIDPKLAQNLHDARADVLSLTPNSAAASKSQRMARAVRDNAPRLIGALTAYMSWIAIFSSSMILLGSVIEEKSSKVLEVLLASASTSDLLVGKVLGVAGIMFTVTAIWAATAFGLASYGFSVLKPETTQAIGLALSGLFSPVHIALLLVYFITGYLMFGITFAAIGAFCETQKDAQAVMGPIMIVLMIPMMAMQTAFVSGDAPVLRYMSYIPVFTPFLMPLRLSQNLPWYEIVGTLVGMGIVAVLMIGMGSRAFRHGALSGARLSWGALLGIGRRPE